MAHHRLGHAEEPRRWLDRAVQGTQEALKSPAEPPGEVRERRRRHCTQLGPETDPRAAASRGGTVDSSSGDEARAVTLTRKAKRTRPKKSHRGFRLRRRMGMVSGHTYDAARKSVRLSSLTHQARQAGKPDLLEESINDEVHAVRRYRGRAGGAGDGGAAQEPRPEEIIDRAIRAHGGEEKLAGLSAFTLKERMVYPGAATYDTQIVVQFPGRYRSERTISSGGKSSTSLIVLDGEQGWMKSNDVVTPYPKTFLESMQKYTVPYTGAAVDPPTPARQKNPACQFTTTGEGTVEGRPAVGLRMKLEGGPEATWYLTRRPACCSRKSSAQALRGRGRGGGDRLRGLPDLRRLPHRPQGDAPARREGRVQQRADRLPRGVAQRGAFVKP